MVTPTQASLAQTLIRESFDLITTAYDFLDRRIDEQTAHILMSATIDRIETTTHALRTAGVQQERSHGPEST